MEKVNTRRIGENGRRAVSLDGDRSPQPGDDGFVLLSGGPGMPTQCR